ncbi:MAG TPA: lysylphosphatidylglycerol synthase transmembrane domain-containing protein [Kofleriaceae bacterium]|nr:lysylphosphatidylglycerol synthase transmembrane domain-containing protein [Kofleriaceae bacterium]
MKLAINLVLSLGMLALCAWLVWPDAVTRQQLEAAFEALEWRSFAPYLFGYIGLLVIVQLTRSLRWNYLLAPLGVRIPPGPLLAISSVGFMAILALPARLGEFVRPGLVRKRGVSASAALGFVAVERIVDGLLVSLFVFGAFFTLRGPQSPGWMMPTAYAALGVFALALVFLIGALKWPERSVQFWLRLSLLPRLAPRFAAVIERKALDMIRGFEVMRDTRNLTLFVAWSLVYWVCNGLGVYLLARAFDLPLTLVGGFATMGLVAVGITLPNSPGLVGQFQWFTLLGLSLYLPGAATKGTAIYGTAFAFANLHYGLQVVWYVLCGALGLATRYVSFHDLWDARKTGEARPD